MENVATAEIARSQVWPWIRHEKALDADHRRSPPISSAVWGIRGETGDDEWFETRGRSKESRELRAGRVVRGARRVPDHPGVRATGLRRPTSRRVAVRHGEGGWQRVRHQRWPE
ncbi:hypothetical protein [Pseudofrankia sp. BMG5.37]|uniref:hypothetical protein n=1 Tax=Pseudofrankia sp. BMG5.37 TaxID=3050035 RepID=UPI000E2A037D